MALVRNEHGSENPGEAMNLGDFIAGIAVMRAAIEEAVR
jgi:N-carbamoyl-L-amino-acid hydrolase